MSLYTRAGWDVIVMIGGYQYPSSKIVDKITVEAVEGNSTLADITIRPGIGTVDLDSYRGKSVTIDVIRSGAIKRVFTGIVDIPEIDLTIETITLKCTNRREELVNTNLGAGVRSIGYYSDEIFSSPKDYAEELEQRLSTIPYAVDFDGYNVPRLVAWAPKASADYTLTNADIYYGQTKIALANRGRLINRVNLTFQYRYERDYHIERGFEWASPINSDYCTLLIDGYSLTFRSMVQAAADSAGWPLQSAITFGAVLPSGWYTCGWATIAWSPVSLKGVTSVVTDDAGNVVTDSNGNPVTETRITSYTNYSNLYCLSATWNATTRWSQTLTEEYSVVVQATQSINQYGVIDREATYGYEDAYVATGWEQYTVFSDLGLGVNYYIDRSTTRTEFNALFNVAVSKARTEILSGHRENRVTFKRDLWTAVEMHHTVTLNCTPIQATGKVTRFTHYFDVFTTEAYTEVELSLFKSQGSGSDTVIAPPTVPADSIDLNGPSITLGNHFGEDPDTAWDTDSWTGMVGNKFVGGVRTAYSEAFIVKTPAIDDEFRKSKTLTGSGTYEVAIPNNTLVIVNDGKV